jgi:uncharacterized membrane protein
LSYPLSALDSLSEYKVTYWRYLDEGGTGLKRRQSRERKPEESHEAEGDLQFERVVFFSDALFAIAITLLIIELRVPAGIEGGIIAYLQRGIIQGQMLSFIISFLVIGTYWVAHHRQFKHIKRYDRRLIWLNLFFLMSVVFLPFVTSVIGEYGNEPGAVALYAISVSITGFTLVLLWLHATDHNRLVDPGLDGKFIRFFTWRAALPAVLFSLSAPLAFLPFEGAPYVAMASWALIFFIRPLLSRIYGFHE